MAVHIRLARHGSKKHPFYRIVVADQRACRDGRFIERIGTYDPSANPGALRIDHGRLDYWKQKGANASHTLEQLLKRNKPEASDSAHG